MDVKDSDGIIRMLKRERVNHHNMNAKKITRLMKRN